MTKVTQQSVDSGTIFKHECPEVLWDIHMVGWETEPGRYVFWPAGAGVRGMQGFDTWADLCRALGPLYDSDRWEVCE